MTAPSVYAAVSEIVKLFTDHYGTDNVDLPNKKFTAPANGDGWARIRVNHTDGGQGSLGGADGSKLWDRAGVFQIELYTKAGKGMLTPYGEAEDVQTIFQGARTASGVWFRNVRIEEPTEQDASPWFRIDVTGAFEYHQIA
jgi:hypothetical protein